MFVGPRSFPPSVAEIQTLDSSDRSFNGATKPCKLSILVQGGGLEASYVCIMNILGSWKRYLWYLWYDTSGLSGNNCTSGLSGKNCTTGLSGKIGTSGS